MQKTIHSPHAEVISQTLVHIRRSAKLTQRQLAERLGREHSFVAHYELGERRVDLAGFYWICEACHTAAPVHAANIMKAFAELQHK